MKISFVQWPTRLRAGDAVWQSIAVQVHLAKPDVLITNEMPFGAWLASSAQWDATLAAQSVQAHEDGLRALHALDLAWVLSSRPVSVNTMHGPSLANEAFALHAGGYHSLHHKHFFPSEPGWQEADWFRCAQVGFEVTQCGPLRVGVLLCTELMFNEYARAYGRAGCHLIIVPRASGTTLHTWHAACAMAAIVSGCYVVSANRVGQEPNGPLFGGVGMAYGPDGRLVCVSSDEQPLQSLHLDLAYAEQQKNEYPCYVKELP
jgi:N-carbamoylputrescine amidase